MNKKDLNQLFKIIIVVLLELLVTVFVFVNVVPTLVSQKDSLLVGLGFFVLVFWPVAVVYFNIKNFFIKESK